MKLLITGGAGYIGSHLVRMLTKRSDVGITVLDTLENGFREAISEGTSLVQGSTGDKILLEKLFEQNQFDAVIHFAAYLQVEESVRNPVKYFRNNLIEPLVLLETMEKFQVKFFIFSSSAAVYGFPKQVPIPESHPKKPESPYGLSKWNMEQILSIYDRRNVFRSISLRYFNACGASFDGEYGESHDPETHMVPLAIRTSLGLQKSFTLFGSDYKTRDGSCERDYVHIEDLGLAHILALEALMNGHKTDVYNVATGLGITNKEVIEEVKKQAGTFDVLMSGRRAGDPDVLVADPRKIITDLAWKPLYSDITSIVSGALEWHKKYPRGYISKKSST